MFYAGSSTQIGTAALSLRLPSDSDVDGADYYIEPDPGNVLKLVAEIVRAAKAKCA